MKQKIASLFLTLLGILSLTGCALSNDSQEEILNLLKEKQVIEKNWDYVDYYADSINGTVNFVYVDPLNAYNVVSIPNAEQEKYDISVNTNVVLSYAGDGYTGFEEAEETSNWEVTIDGDDLHIAKLDD